MGISDRTRKILWGRSGNRCAFCKRVLVEDGTATDGESVVGDECHIIGEKPGAARGALGIDRDDLDEYSNLILLCKVHHKLVDDQEQTYTVEKLRDMKHAHERWVSQTLSNRGSSEKPPKLLLLHRLKTGKELGQVIGEAYAYIHNHNELNSHEEAELVSSFLQNIQDWGDIWSDLDSGEQVKTCFSLTLAIKEVEEAGFFVFGVCDRRGVRSGDCIMDWPVAIVTIVRNTNPSITELGDLPALIRH